MTDPGFIFGQVPTAAMWNSAFDAKQNTLGFTPVNRAGDAMGGKLVTTASIAAAAGFSILPGVAPSSPINGDIWLTSAGVFAQVNGSTEQLATGGAVNSGTANQLSYYATSGAAISGNPNLTVFNGALTLGQPASIAGTLILSGLVSGGVTLASPNAGGSGTITFPAGSINFGATGGTSQVVKQTSAGGIFTVGRLAIGDLSNGTLGGTGAIVTASSSTGTGAIVYANAPTLTGTATATALQFFPTTSGIIGTTTNDNAATGVVGEFISAILASGSAIVLTSGTVGNIANVSLTAGDWDLSGATVLTGSGSTTVTFYQTSISTTSATLNTTPGNLAQGPGFGGGSATIFGGGTTPTLNVGPVRISIASTTTVYLVVEATFSAGGTSAYGFIRARRVR